MLHARTRHARPRRAVQFESTDHLSPEAVAAYVDGELTPGAVRRAMMHLEKCSECRREIAAQYEAAARIRCSCHEEIRAPDSLIARLTSIESHCVETSGVGQTGFADDIECGNKQRFIERIGALYRVVKQLQERDARVTGDTWNN